jgi:hypothetical protein
MSNKEWYTVTAAEVATINAMPVHDAREAIRKLGNGDVSLKLVAEGESADWTKHWSHTLVEGASRAYIKRADGWIIMIKNVDGPTGMQPPGGDV